MSRSPRPVASDALRRAARGAVLGARVAVALVVAAALVRSGAAAGSDAAGPIVTTVTTPGPIAVVDDRGRTVGLPAPARRIVTLLPSLTETVCALDACDRLVGVDRWSDWPAQVASLPRVGGLEDTAIERIVALRPDVVLAASSSRAIERLESLGLRVLALEPQGHADTRRVLRAVAQVLGRPDDGDALWRRIDARIDAAALRVPATMRGTRVYFEVSDAPYAAGEASFIGETLARLGMRNVVPASLGPFPQLNPEFVVRASPELVIASARAIAAMPSRPGWASIAALRERRTCAFAPGRYDVLVRPGPRLGEAAEAIADCIVSAGTARGASR